MNIRQVSKYKVVKTINISASGISLSNTNHVKPASLPSLGEMPGPSQGRTESKVCPGSLLFLLDPLQGCRIRDLYSSMGILSSKCASNKKAVNDVAISILLAPLGKKRPNGTTGIGEQILKALRVTC